MYLNEDIVNLCGKTIGLIDLSDKYQTTLSFDDGTSYKIYHYKGCCEQVYFHSCDGNAADLIGHRLIYGDIDPNDTAPAGFDPDSADIAQQWSTINLTASNGKTLKIRWFGTSNGYYSTGIDLEQVIDEPL